MTTDEKRAMEEKRQALIDLLCADIYPDDGEYLWLCLFRLR